MTRNDEDEEKDEDEAKPGTCGRYGRWGQGRLVWRG